MPNNGPEGNYNQPKVMNKITYIDGNDGPTNVSGFLEARAVDAK